MIMAQGVVKPLIPFEALVKSVVELRPEDKRRLWELLNEEIAQSEEEVWEQGQTVQAQIWEARAAYQTGDDILEELKKFTTTERLTIAEAALHLIREDLQPVQSAAWSERRQQLTAAAEALLPDYAAGGELTTFTALDSEDFYAQG
jgi:hypothetical protein